MLRRSDSHYRLLPCLLLLSACAGGGRTATTASPETTTTGMATSERGEVEMVKPTTASPDMGRAASTKAATTTAEQIFGAPLSSAASVLTTSQLLSAGDKYQGQTVVVEGQIVEVCQSKGCWMTFMASGVVIEP